MNEDERISVLTMFQTLKAKTSRLLDPVVQSEGITILQTCVLFHLYQQDAASLTRPTPPPYARRWSGRATSPEPGAAPTGGW